MCVLRECWILLFVGAWICDGIPAAKQCCGCDCFPAAARVSLGNGKSTTMSELKIGDRVQTGSPFDI